VVVFSFFPFGGIIAVFSLHIEMVEVYSFSLCLPFLGLLMVSFFELFLSPRFDLFFVVMKIQEFLPEDSFEPTDHCFLV